MQSWRQWRHSIVLKEHAVSRWVQYREVLPIALNPLTPNDHYSGRTAPLTSKRCILYIYSTNTGTEYFKHGTYSPLFSLQNAVFLIILTYLVPVLFTFYIQGVVKLKKNNNSGAKSLSNTLSVTGYSTDRRFKIPEKLWGFLSSWFRAS